MVKQASSQREDNFRIQVFWVEVLSPGVFVFLCLYAELGVGEGTLDLKIHVLCRQCRIWSKGPERSKQTALMLGNQPSINPGGRGGKAF